VAWTGRLLALGHRRLCRGAPGRMVLAGAALTIGVAGGAAAVAWALVRLAGALGPLGLVVEALALKTVLAVRGLALAAGGVARDLERGHLDSARAAVGHHLVSRPTASLDAAHVASAAVESVAENLTDSIVAPLLFYAVLGLPGAAAYRVVNTADAMIGYREGDLARFGRVAARLDDLLNLVPARLAGLLVVLASALGGAEAGGAWCTMWREHRRTASPNAGWTMAAMAGALGVRLEKRDHYTLGEGRAPSAADIRMSLRVLARATVLGGALAAALAGWIRLV
jgi:adenosylcobinamide-phosphate synthase